LAPYPGHAIKQNKLAARIKQTKQRCTISFRLFVCS